MPEKFNELLLKQDIIELYNTGITPDYGYLLNGRFEKDMIKTLYPLKTLSGNPISWEASDMEYLFPVVSLEPKQAGSGDPSPENVRPITGRDEVTVNIRGNNLLDPTSFTAGVLNSDGGINYSQDYKTTGFISVIAGARISHTHTGANGNYFYSAEKQFISNISSSTGVDITVPDNAVYLRFSATNDSAEVMVNFGKALLPYEPYQPGETSTLTFPETIYGGTVDAVTGVESKTWGYIASYNGESLPGEWISDRDVYSAGTTPTTGAQVAYKLATPEPFQATGNQALTIQPGNHTMYTDGNNISLSRKARRLEV